MRVPAHRHRLAVVPARHSASHSASRPSADIRVLIGWQISPLKAQLANGRRGGGNLSGGRDAGAYSGGIARPRAHTA